jgi:hypothetical protein
LFFDIVGVSSVSTYRVSYARILSFLLPLHFWRGAGGEAERCPGEVEKPANFAETGLGKK